MKVEKLGVNSAQDEISNSSTWSGSSGESTFKRRPQVGDRIFVSSQSVIYLGDFENKLINVHAYDFKNEEEVRKLKIFFTIPRPVLRKKLKPAPFVRILVYKTDLRECQEASLFIEGLLYFVNSHEINIKVNKK